MANTVKKYRAIFLAVVIAMLFLVLPVRALAVEKPLDEIQDYTIQIDMRNDGTMDIKYHIEWKVLDDETDGPLSWVKIGIPNKNVDEMTALTENIDDIEYNKQSDQVYAYVYLDRDYYAGEIITFEFSIHQSNMYVRHRSHRCFRHLRRNSDG